MENGECSGDWKVQNGVDIGSRVQNGLKSGARIMQNGL